jgi:hypothetical protein
MESQKGLSAPLYFRQHGKVAREVVERSPHYIT